MGKAKLEIELRRSSPSVAPGFNPGERAAPKMKSAEGTNDWVIGRFDDFEFLIFEFVWSASWRMVLGIWDLK